MSNILITPEVDAMVAVLEDGGATWHVIGGSRVIDPYLTFELPTKQDLISQTIEAMASFAKLFSTSADVRTSTIEYALAVGAFFVEFGNHHPVIHDGRTVQ